MEEHYENTAREPDRKRTTFWKKIANLREKQTDVNGAFNKYYCEYLSVFQLCKNVTAVRELRDARRERNLALCDLFFITRKIVQFQEYKRLRAEEEAKAEALYAHYDEGTVITDRKAVTKKQADWDKARNLSQMAFAEFWGRETRK